MVKVSWKTRVKVFLRDRFSVGLIGLLLVVGLGLLISEYLYTPETLGQGQEVHFFYHPQCPHCKKQMPFNEELIDRYPGVQFVYHDVTKGSENALLLQYIEQRGLGQAAVPATFIGDVSFVGFDEVETTGAEIERALQAFLQGEHIEQQTIDKTSVTLPFVGTIDALDYSLVFLAIVLGFVDGFNPCAMWVLVYLISLILSLKDRRKIWLLVGSFVFASGVLYFLFMTAWLNVFLLVGYMRPLTLIIGLGAVYVGVQSIRSYYKTKGALVCDVGDQESKTKTMNKMEKIVHSPITWASVFAIIGLAFIVNSIEFACSAAIPAVFTHVLSLSALPTWQYYGYILLYDLFFMLDDLIIFGLAAFAINTSIGDKYAKYCKLIGGGVLLILGVMLLFGII